MIKGFSQETAPLSQKELDLIPVFIASLKKHIGKANAVTATSIADGILTHCKVKLTGSRIRKIINHIRINDLVPCLVSNSNGYYVCNDADEVEQYINSLLDRSSAIIAVANALKGQKIHLCYNS